jgi:polyisoprenoid-binding protein YceI
MMKNTYLIDPAHSSIQFSIRHMMISNVKGTFAGVKGTVVYDPENVSSSTVNAEIDIASINTMDEKRDAHLKSADFFEAEKYPKMTFKSKRVEKTSEDEFRVTGDLTIHGVTKDVVLTVTDVAPEGKDPWGNTRTGASARGKINRKDFGLTWSAPLETGGVLVGDDVKLELEVEMIKQASAAS